MYIWLKNSIKLTANQLKIKAEITIIDEFQVSMSGGP
jgi:hypothetical protein